MTADQYMTLAEVDDLWLTLNWEPNSDLGDKLERLVNTARLGASNGTDPQTEVVQLRKWVSDLQSGMYVNCVYCGHRYGPADAVPVALADVLTDHVRQCPSHPMSKLNVVLEACIAALRSYEHGNASPVLAKSIADSAEAHMRGDDTAERSGEQSES